MRYCVDPSRFYVVTFFRQSTKLPKDLNGFEPLFYKIQLYALAHYATSLTKQKTHLEYVLSTLFYSLVDRKSERQDSNLRQNGFTLLRYRYFLYQLRYFPNLKGDLVNELSGGKLRTTETGLVGFEPTYHGVKVRCLTTWR